MSNRKKNIVLFNPRASSYGDQHEAPLGLLSICKDLDKAQFNIKIYASWIEKNYEQKIIEDCKDACCFGVTSMTGYQIIEGLKISERVKRLYPQLPIVWGGYHPTILPEQTLQNRNIDVVVRGQGEETFQELIAAFLAERDLTGIHGITYKKNGSIIHNPDRGFQDINKFGTLPYELIDIEKYIHVSEIGRRTIEYISSQGCIFDCGFCVEPKIYNRRWYSLGVERILDDIENLVKNYGIDSILFQDTNFFLSEERVIRICEGLLKKSIKIAWGHANGRAPEMVKFAKGSWDLIKQSGCRNILIGAESAVQSVLDYLNKRAKLEDNFKIADICARYDIGILYSMMIGLPSDKNLRVTNKGQLDAIISLSKRVLKQNKSNIILIFAYTPYPGTYLYAKSLEAGFIPPESLEGWGKIELHRHSTPWISKKEIEYLDYLTSFIFRYVAGRRWDYIRHQKNITKKIALTCIYLIANFRWKLKFFCFHSLEYRLYITALKIKAKGLSAVII